MPPEGLLEKSEPQESLIKAVGRGMLHVLNVKNWSWKNLSPSDNRDLPPTKLDNLMRYGTLWPDRDNPRGIVRSIEVSPSSAWQELRNESSDETA